MAAMTDILTLPAPDDWHVHLRDGAALSTTVTATARVFRRAIVMPNLKPPVTTTALAEAYRARILAAVPPHLSFQPLMTLYLTDHTTPEEIRRAQASGVVFGVKYYPAGATTHAEAGVTALERVYPALTALAECGMPLLIHGEVTDPGVDVFDREAVFIERHLEPLIARFPTLRVVLEHITTRAAVDFVLSAPATVAATITAHHLLYNRNAMFQGGLRTHYYCLPVLKREVHRQALLAAATSGHPKFFLGTDSAPHARQAKEAACGCAGLYTAPCALELYAEAFESVGAVDKLAGFAARHGAAFYGLPVNTGTVTLQRTPWRVATEYAFQDGVVIPLRAGEIVQWRLCDHDHHQ